MNIILFDLTSNISCKLDNVNEIRTQLSISYFKAVCSVYKTPITYVLNKHGLVPAWSPSSHQKEYLHGFLISMQQYIFTFPFYCTIMHSYFVSLHPLPLIYPSTFQNMNLSLKTIVNQHA